MPRVKKDKAPAYPCRDFYSKFLANDMGVDCWAEWLFHESRKWRLDYAFPSHLVGIEIDGGIYTYGRHSGGAGQKADMEKMNAAAERGWLILHFTPDEKLTSAALKTIKHTLSLRQGDENMNNKGV